MGSNELKMFIFTIITILGEEGEATHREHTRTIWALSLFLFVAVVASLVSLRIIIKDNTVNRLNISVGFILFDR